MKIYDFDQVASREGTSSVKWEMLKQYQREDIIPMWIADMEFKTPDFIVDAVKQRAENEIYGYTAKTDRWYEAIINWQEKRNNFKVSKDMISFSPGIVPGLAMAVNAFTKKGDKIMIQQPVYPPFINAIKNNGRKILNNPLKVVDGQFEIDFELFKKQAKSAKMFILCNPHNPGGRVWSREELKKMAKICYKNKVVVVSDEIHSDLTFSGHKFHAFATVSPEAAKISLTFNSPSKPFNMAGFATAYAIAPEKKIHEAFENYSTCQSMLYDGNVFAYNTVEAAYNHGEQWLEQMMKYVEENVKYTLDFLRENTPKIKFIVPQASYLIFLDCRQLGMSQTKLVDFFIKDVKLLLNDGATFGKEGKGFMRLNLAYPRQTIEKALNQLKEAYDKKIK